MLITAIFKGIALGFVLSISVGPVIFSIIKQSINNGHKGGYFFIAGVSASDIALVIVCNMFTTLFESAQAHGKIIGIAGSIFLVAMGVYNIFFKKTEIKEDVAIENRVFRKRDLAGIFLSGFFMNLLNPAVFIFWFAASATIMADALTATHPTEYRLLVFITCLAFVLLADVAKVLLAGKIRTSLTPRNIHNLNRVAGLVFIGFGVALFWGILFGEKLVH